MLNIVVVEDEYTIRTGLCRLISKLSDDYHVIGSAENGYDGMLLIKQCQPDLAICDIKMGKHGGLEMIEQLRDLNIKCHFVILSGYSEFPYAQKAIQLGVEDYLLKPVMVDHLRELLHRMEALVSKENGNHPGTDSQYPEKNPYSQLVKNAVHKIQKEYFTKLSLSDIASEFGVTSEYLSALFAKETGMNFVTYLKKFRITKAQELLLQTDKKIYEIAFAVGYDDPAYFYRVFKEATGVSPKTYLRNQNS